MSLHTWALEDFRGEKTAVCRDIAGMLVSRWTLSRVGYLIRNTSDYGPGWVRPKHGVPAMVVELLGRQGVPS